MGVNITTIAHLRVLIIEIGSTIILLVVEAQGYCFMKQSVYDSWSTRGVFCQVTVFGAKKNQAVGRLETCWKYAKVGGTCENAFK